jgi:hypothetical protein
MAIADLPNINWSGGVMEVPQGYGLRYSFSKVDGIPTYKIWLTPQTRPTIYSLDHLKRINRYRRRHGQWQICLTEDELMELHLLGKT